MAKITIKEIALLAGVSKTAVSFAFNKPEKLPKVTVDRILEIAKNVGYYPDPLAAGFNSKKTGTIGLLLPQGIEQIISNPFYQLLIKGIGQQFERSGIPLLLVPPRKGSMTTAISKAVVDGFLTVGLESHHEGMEVLKQRNIPFVMIDSDPIPGIPCVNIDDNQGAYISMRHLLELGHRDIAIFSFFAPGTGNYKNYTGVIKRRLEGYIRALEEFNLSLDNKKIQIFECGLLSIGVKNAFELLWSSNNKPTAIITMSDLLALNTMDIAKQKGLILPDDLSITGFDNIEKTSHSFPTLTTIEQPILEKGKLAGKVLESLLEGKIVENLYTLETKLVVRNSTSEPRKK